MKLILLTAGAATLCAGEVLSTDYTKDRALRVEVESTMSNETTSMEILIDGEPMDRGGRGGGGRSSSTTKSYAFVDTVLAHEDGRPTKVRRAFGDVEGTATMEFGEESRDNELESKFADLTLVLTKSDDGAEVEIADGEAPGDEQLQGHSLDLQLDALFPDDEIELGAKWDVESDAFMHAVGADVERKIYRVEREPREGGERGERGGGRNRRGFGGGGGNTGLAMLADGDWDISAVAKDELEDVDGVECIVIEYEAEVSGEIEETGGRGGRDFAFGLAGAGAPIVRMYEATIEGRLCYSPEEKRPVLFEIDGEITIETEIERETQRGVMEMSSTQEIEFEQSVRVTVEDRE